MIDDSRSADIFAQLTARIEAQNPERGGLAGSPSNIRIWSAIAAPPQPRSPRSQLLPPSPNKRKIRITDQSHRNFAVAFLVQGTL